MRYPTRNGLVIPPHELELAPSKLDPANKGNWNNHHGWHPKPQMVGSFILRTLRNLDAYQYPMLIDQHDYVHDFDPPPIPRLIVAMNRLEQAYETSEPLRTGSLHHPTYDVIGIDLWSKIIDEYCLEAA